MILPNWIKVAWWLLLVVLLTIFLAHRYPELTVGHAVPADIVVFIVWVALLLAPLFSEVSLLGITFKQRVDELKGFLADQFTDVKSEVRNAVDVRTTFSPHFTIPAPVADAQLPEIERRIKSVVSNALVELGIKESPPPAQIPVPSEVALLFATRYNMEKELRRIGESRQLVGEIRRPMPAMQLTRALVQAELLEPRLANAIREVYSVCSPALHGEPVSEAQVAFVKDIGPELIAALSAIT